MISDTESQFEASPGTAEQANLERLEEEIERLQQVAHEFHAYKSEVMAMHGVADEITHESMKRDFLRLRDNIQSWVDACEKYEKRGHFMKRFEEAVGGEMDGRKDLCFSLFDMFQAYGGNIEQLGWLRHYPDTCNCVILTLVVWDTLKRSVFLEGDLLGMDREAMGVIVGISEKMCSQNETEVGRKRAGKWRAAAFRTCLATVEFQSQCQQEAKDLQETLARRLELWISKDVLRKHEGQLNSQVIQAAIKLSQDMCCSPTRLSFAPPGLAAFPSRPGDLSRLAGTLELKNIRTWTTLNTGDAEGYFCCLFPALCVATVDEPLVKPLVVAYKKDSTTTAPENPSKLVREYDELQQKRQSPEVRKRDEIGDSSYPRSLRAWMVSSWGKPVFRPKMPQKHPPSASRSNTDAPRSAPPYRSSHSDNGIYGGESRSHGTQFSRPGRRGSLSTAAGPSSLRAEAPASANVITRVTFPRSKESGRSSKSSSSTQRAAPGISVDDRPLIQGRHGDRQQPNYGERAVYQPGTQFPEGTMESRWEEPAFSPV